MSKTLEDIWGSNKNIVDKLGRTGWAGIGKVRQIFGDSKGAHDMYEQANPREDWDKTGTYFDGTPRNNGNTFIPLAPAFDNLKEERSLPINTATSSISTSNPYAAQQARDNALKIADIDERLRLMPNQLNRINQAEQNRYANIEDSFNRANAGLDSHWKQTQEDYNTARNQRLANRRRQISVSDDDFKKQNDAYARYFSRTGSGSSSTALYSVPALLARATQKIRNDIETNNAEQANEQDTNFNRANLEYKREKDNILNLRARQRKETKQDFDTRRSGYWDARSGLEREKANYQNRSVADIMAAGRDASDKANRYADEAVRAGNLTEDIKFKPINFQNVAPKDFNYDPTKTKVVEDKEEDSDSLYRKYFRDKEEDKKKKGWITGVGV